MLEIDNQRLYNENDQLKHSFQRSNVIISKFTHLVYRYINYVGPIIK